MEITHKFISIQWWTASPTGEEWFLVYFRPVRGQLVPDFLLFSFRWLRALRSWIFCCFLFLCDCARWDLNFYFCFCTRRLPLLKAFLGIFVVFIFINVIARAEIVNFFFLFLRTLVASSRGIYGIFVVFIFINVIVRAEIVNLYLYFYFCARCLPLLEAFLMTFCVNQQ